VANWGTRIVTKSVNGFPLRVFEPRPSSIASALDEGRKWGEREFIVYGDRRITFIQFLAAVDRATTHLRSLGVAPMRPSAILAANSPEWLLAFWAMAKLRATVVLGNSWWVEREVAAALLPLKPDLILVDERRRSALPPGIPNTSIEDLQQFFAVDAPQTPCVTAMNGEEEDIAIVFYTSGTTGASKAAMLSHRAILASAQNLMWRRGRRTPADCSPSDSQVAQLFATPLFHIGATVSQFSAMLTGNKCVLLKGSAEGGRILDLLQAENVQGIAVVPTIMSRIIRHPSVIDRDLSFIKSVGVAGAMFTRDLIDEITTTIGNPHLSFATMFGMTETGGAVTFTDGAEYAAHPNSAGTVMPLSEVRIDGPGPEGEILTRSGAQMTGYWGKSDDQTIDADGWIHTGDLGRFDDDGHLYITGRLKDIIIRGGENISASEVEGLIERHPSVAEVAVIGLAHSDLGEEVGAVVVTRPNVHITPDAFAEFLSAKIAYFQIPSRWWIRQDPLPLNANGKIHKGRLRDEWLRGGPPANQNPSRP
jgi:long-chain acyl-CoA synthetase